MHTGTLSKACPVHQKKNLNVRLVFFILFSTLTCYAYFCRQQQSPLTAVVSTSTMTRYWSRTGRITCFSGASSGTQWVYKTASCTETSWAACSKWESLYDKEFIVHVLLHIITYMYLLVRIFFIITTTPLFSVNIKSIKWLSILHLCICDIFCIYRNIDLYNTFNCQRKTMDGQMS